MNRYSFAYDIETAPLPEVHKEILQAKEPFVDKEFDPSQWKTAKGIARNKAIYESTKDKRLQKHIDAQNKLYDRDVKDACLSADRGHIICISYALETGNYVQWADDVDEAHLLGKLWERCESAQRYGGQIFSASGTNFDVRIPWRRSLQLGVKFPSGLQLITNKGYRPQVHRSFVDLIEVYAAGEYGFKIRVNDLCRAFNVDPKNELEGVTGKNFWIEAQSDRDKAERYALRDSMLVWEIAKKMDECGVWLESPPPSSRIRPDDILYREEVK